MNFLSTFFITNYRDTENAEQDKRGEFQSKIGISIKLAMTLS
jgi:hypothetical protein